MGLSKKFTFNLKIITLPPIETKNDLVRENNFSKEQKPKSLNQSSLRKIGSLKSQSRNFDEIPKFTTMDIRGGLTE